VDVGGYVLHADQVPALVSMSSRSECSSEAQWGRCGVAALRCFTVCRPCQLAKLLVLLWPRCWQLCRLSHLVGMLTSMGQLLGACCALCVLRELGLSQESYSATVLRC
jgi:hypothetical protein